MSGQDIIHHLRALPPAERRRVIGEIWEEFADRDLRLTEKEAAELDRRLGEHVAEPNNVIPWEDIRAATDAKYRRPS